MRLDVETIILLCLGLTILLIYCKRRIEKYPISPSRSVIYNNYSRNISNYKLNVINDVLIVAQNDFNGTEEITFNEGNDLARVLDNDEKLINKLGGEVISTINNHLPQEKNIKIVNVKNMISVKAGNQIKKDFDCICEYNLDGEKMNDNLIINMSIILTKDNEKIYIENLSLTGLVSQQDLYLPGSNNDSIKNNYHSVYEMHGM